MIQNSIGTRDTGACNEMLHPSLSLSPPAPLPISLCFLLDPLYCHSLRTVFLTPVLPSCLHTVAGWCFTSNHVTSRLKTLLWFSMPWEKEQTSQLTRLQGAPCLTPVQLLGHLAPLLPVSHGITET